MLVMFLFSNSVSAQYIENEKIWAEIDKAAKGEVAAFLVSKKPKKLPTLIFKDIKGEDISSESWRGRFILLNLWATWCAPCRHEMPDLDALQAQLGSDDFAVIPISTDRGDIAKAVQFYEDIAIENLPLYHDEKGSSFRELRNMGRARGLPFTMIIDKEGYEIGYMNGPADWDSEDAINLIKTITTLKQ